MTVDEFAENLRNLATILVDEGWYHNAFHQRGYRAQLRIGDRWFWYSVSNTDLKIAPDEVAAAITSPVREVSRAGTYRSSNGKLGFEATMRCAEHHYMLGAGRIGSHKS